MRLAGVAGTEVDTRVSLWELLAFALRTLDVPYWWGGNQRLDLVPVDGFDCSGHVGAYLRHVSYGDERWAVRRTAESIRAVMAASADAWRVPLGSEQPGDVLFWVSARGAYHVAVCLLPGYLLGAQGGSSSVRGDNPNARVKVASIYAPSEVQVYRWTATHPPSPSLAADVYALVNGRWGVS